MQPNKQLLLSAIIQLLISNCQIENAGVAKLVDVPDLGSGAARCGGSSPFARTNKPSELRWAEGFLNLAVCYKPYAICFLQIIF